ncbi:MAG TPA: SDR family NAD(P)-dependent oxidoreductase [Candidatus Baltobacteraceae bacterium]|jgi:NAD(P)-dependent dehydrogenase (short-subunit alcohol dehydrogenase family)|nr:SDR family NAD(P)-dependent oxidoreductase [Candidatus Baltobacteraceae bacterium]
MNTTTWFEKGHVALVTGGSKGLGKAVARRLLECELSVIIDGRDPIQLEDARRELAPVGNLVAIAGDVADINHVRALIAAAHAFGRLDLIVNNASTLGETPLPRVEELSESTLARIFQINVFAPLCIIRLALPLLRRSGDRATIVNVSSDAAVEAYSGWGGYGASKAALEHLSRVLSVELDGSHVRVLVVDPGDMNTDMHRAAVPDADFSTLADPNQVARALLDAVATTDRYRRIALASAEVA